MDENQNRKALQDDFPPLVRKGCREGSTRLNALVTKMLLFTSVSWQPECFFFRQGNEGSAADSVLKYGFNIWFIHFQCYFLHFELLGPSFTSAEEHIAFFIQSVQVPESGWSYTCCYWASQGTGLL